MVIVFGAMAAAGELLLPTHGPVGLIGRVAVFLAIPPVLYLTGFAHAEELDQARSLLSRVRAGRGTPEPHP